MKVVGIIPARYKSSRYPGKPLVLINGVPMVIRVAKRVAMALGKENTYVATDDDLIASSVQEAGYKVVMTADTHLTGTDRLAEAARKIEADIYLNIQGDEPIVNPDDILKVAEEKSKHPDAIINGMTKLLPHEDPFDVNLPKVLTNSFGKLLYMSRLALPGIKNLASGEKPVYYKQVCIYAFTFEDLQLFNSTPNKPVFEYFEDIEILRFFDFGIPIQMVEFTSQTMAVDKPEDVIAVEKYLAEHGDDFYL